MVRTDTNGKTERYHEAEVTPDLGPVTGAIVVEGGSRSLDPEAEKERDGSDFVPIQDQDTDIGLDAGVG
jgi:hypothetical protein